MLKLPLACFLALFICLRALAGTEAPQSLGTASPIPFDFLLFTGKDNHFAWFSYGNLLQRELIRVDLETGKSATLDLTSLGAGAHRALLFPIPGKNTLLGFTGDPPRFIEVDPDKMTFSPVSPPVVKKSHHAFSWREDSGTMDDHGKLYVGLFPDSRLVSFDAATGQYRDYGTIADDPKQQFVRSPLVAHDGRIVFCPVGLFRAQLWAVDPQSGAKRQILPPELMIQGSEVTPWRAADGQIYGSLRNSPSKFLCLKDQVKIVPAAPAPTPADETFRGNHILHLTDGSVEGLDAAGHPVFFQTDFSGGGGTIFSLPVVYGHMLLGSTCIPGELFGVNLTTGKITGFGQKSSGRIEIYDILRYKDGLILGSYTGSNIDYLDSLSSKPHRLAELSKEPWQQERPVQLAQGSDAAIYVATIPIKGQLGGALTRIDPEKDVVTVHRNIIPHQSVLSVVPVPHSPLLFCTTGVRGGDSAVPVEKEACIFLWDTTKQAIVFQAQPIPGADQYLRALPLPNGEIFCLASGGKFVFFDPVSRTVTHSGKIDSEKFKFPFINPILVGKKKEVIIYGSDEVFSVDSANGTVQSLFRFPPQATYGCYTTGEGVLYYGANTIIYREDLSEAVK